MYVCYGCVWVGIKGASSPASGPTKPWPHWHSVSIPLVWPILINWISRCCRYPIPLSLAAKGLGVPARDFSIFRRPLRATFVFFFFYYTGACERGHTHTRGHIHTHTHAYMHTHVHTHTPRHAHTHVHTHAPTHAHTHMLIRNFARWSCSSSSRFRCSPFAASLLHRKKY